jgi:DNA invertase Pin-like site-specific DNA recombinase
MKIGYARTSTIEQNYSLEDQIEKLEQMGCEKIFSEQVSSVQERPEFQTCIEFAREGDVVVITKLDRFARSITDLWKHITKLEQKGASLHILDLNLDTATPTGRLQITLLGGIAQWEREMMLERQRIGIAKAKADGKYKGRKPTARNMGAEIHKLHTEGKKPSVIAKELNIGVASVYRYRDGRSK